MTVFGDSDRSFEEIVKEAQENKNNYYVSCWYSGVGESLPMWNLYAGKFGVMVRFNKAELEPNVKHNTSFTLTSGIVKEDEEAPFFKHKYYKYENEYRFAMQPKYNESNVKIVSVDLDSFTNIEVRFHPMAPEWHVRSIKKLYEDYPHPITFTNSEIAIYSDSYIDEILAFINGNPNV